VFDETPDIGDYYISIDLAGFEDVSKKRTKNSKLDESAIAVVKVNENGWHLENIIHGRWDLAETARKIFEAVRDYRPISVGIERGISKQAVMSPLMDMMKQNGRFFVVEELTHGNRKKTDRKQVARVVSPDNGVREKPRCLQKSTKPKVEDTNNEGCITLYQRRQRMERQYSQDAKRTIAYA
jgi:hypothetical protein